MHLFDERRSICVPEKRFCAAAFRYVGVQDGHAALGERAETKHGATARVGGSGRWGAEVVRDAMVARHNAPLCDFLAEGIQRVGRRRGAVDRNKCPTRVRRLSRIEPLDSYLLLSLASLALFAADCPRKGIVIGARILRLG